MTATGLDRKRTNDGHEADHSDAADHDDGPESQTVLARGHTVAYTEYGDPDGTPLLLFHGTPGSRLLGRLFDEEGRAAGVRVLAIDRPGYGDSEAWPGFGLDDVSEIAAPVLEAAGVAETGVLGFSGGAPAALALAADRPALVRSVDLVAGAAPPALGGGPPRQLRILAAMARRAPRLLGGLLRSQAWLARRGKRSVVVGQYADSDGIPPRVERIVTDDFLAAIRSSTAGAVREFARADAPWPFELDEIGVRVRCWHGTDDDNVPIEGARKLVGRLPDSTLTQLQTDHLETLLESRKPVLEANRQT